MHYYYLALHCMLNTIILLYTQTKVRTTMPLLLVRARARAFHMLFHYIVNAPRQILHLMHLPWQQAAWECHDQTSRQLKGRQVWVTTWGRCGGASCDGEDFPRADPRSSCCTFAATRKLLCHTRQSLAQFCTHIANPDFN